ncbi:unnamed protein product [Cyprideis torosa]|uniref:Ubiquitin-like domain-containing CTD phosphatase 1 n=1 Tax=Cyprideis torosa TaxID=163714 RepID=A0A7R8W9G9_9CRUS|nr:unnamed protein product [Cyprideis torosa]CAG0887336.1 unnamed protein product [Cyprideis torosa]
MDVCVKWAGQEYKICGLLPSCTVSDLKEAIREKTQVLPDRQKLLNLKYKGKAAADDVPLAALELRPGFKVMMMGSREEAISKVLEEPGDSIDIVDDFDIGVEFISIPKRAEYISKVERRVKEYEIKMLSEPRDGKKLLVLDIDYTLFDHKSSAENGMELMRPYLHEFLQESYKHYDIVIWSATSMKWIEEKMKVLGVATHPNYKVAFYLDDLAMISVHIDGKGIVNVKPLRVIWDKFPGRWTEKNTIMFDDCSHNFLMNPQSGLKIRPFREAHLNRDTDAELLYLKRYLRLIRKEEDFTVFNHRKWRKHLKRAHRERGSVTNSNNSEGPQEEQKQEEDMMPSSTPPPQE